MRDSIEMEKMKPAKLPEPAIRRLAALEDGCSIRAGSLNGVFAKPGKRAPKRLTAKSTR